MNNKVDKSVWEERMNNLINRRAGRGTSTMSVAPTKVGDYATNLSKVFIGKRVLDIGCGGMIIKKHLSKEVDYVGLDPFPVNEEVTKGMIETYDPSSDKYFDTVFAFAVLDGLQDLDRAFENMKRICKNNLVFLTGLDIEPDEFHTHKITLQLLQDYLNPQFRMTYLEQLNHKPYVVLVEFTRK